VALVTGAGPSGSTPPRVAADKDDGAAPEARAAATYGQRLARVLRAAVPAGYASVTETSFSDHEAVQPASPRAGDAPAQVLAGAVVRVVATPREGRLFAYLVHDDRAVPGDDLCMAGLVRASGSPGTCTVRVVKGVQIRVIVAADAAHGQVIEATRFLSGGWLIVGAAQGPSPGPREYTGVDAHTLPLAVPLLDPAGVAALAADPATLPAR
jgi:hypothetical protein